MIRAERRVVDRERRRSARAALTRVNYANNFLQRQADKGKADTLRRLESLKPLLSGDNETDTLERAISSVRGGLSLSAQSVRELMRFVDIDCWIDSMGYYVWKL